MFPYREHWQLGVNTYVESSLMKLIGKKVLDEVIRKHADVRKQINAWIVEVESASWKTSQDIKNRYQHSSILPDNRVIFNIKGNSYRIDTIISYKNQTVLIKRAGTHAEYDKWTE